MGLQGGWIWHGTALDGALCPNPLAAADREQAALPMEPLWLPRAARGRVGRDGSLQPYGA